MEVFINLLLNVGLLIVIAHILARLKPVKGFIVRDKHTYKDYIVMILIFSMISILSNYTGYGVNGAIANTRVIGVMAGGFIGGPIVAFGTAIIASFHRYSMDINGFATLACTISTLVGGLIAAVSSKKIKLNKYNEVHLFVITFIAESLQMLIILLIAKPFSDAVSLVSAIIVPMTIINPFGMVLFVGVFTNIAIEEEHEIGRKISLTFDITKKCLPLLQTGLFDEENCKIIGDIILEFSKDLAVIFTDTEKIVSVSGQLDVPYKEDQSLPELVQEVIMENRIIVAEDSKAGDLLFDSLKKMSAIGAPLIKNNQVFGCMIIFIPDYKISYHSEIQFADGLSKLLSTQYELSDMEKQRELLQKAEFHALQSQINPHFIFNALNTISSFVREKPEKARELLIALATYFRNSIQTEDVFVSIYDEMDYVDAYLQLVKARFEDRLKVEIDIPKNLECTMPCLVLQPIVENAVIHGAIKRKQGIVNIVAKDLENSVKITISDNGLGIPDDIVNGLKNDTLESDKIGLSNVHKRLCYTYGKDNGLHIESSPQGTAINIYINK